MDESRKMASEFEVKAEATEFGKLIADTQEAEDVWQAKWAEEAREATLACTVGSETFTLPRPKPLHLEYVPDRTEALLENIKELLEDIRAVLTEGPKGDKA